MNAPSTVTFYMEPPLRESARKGAHNFIRRVANVIERAGLEVRYRDFGARGAPAGQGVSLSHMKAPPDDQGLTFRRVYHYPFWQIEQTAERWAWDVAQAAFTPDPDPAEAQRFFAFWQQRLFNEQPQKAKRGGFVYVPLQGRLLEHRSFQSCSPIEMIEHCLANDPHRDIVIGVHPNETYTTAELAALERLERHSRLRIELGGMERLLENCDYVVTQNSSVAFNGYFFRKPALLFGRIDFHHIAVQADMTDLAHGFDSVTRISPDYPGYVHWFWQKRCINAGRPDAEEKIAMRLRRFGWPV